MKKTLFFLFTAGLLGAAAFYCWRSAAAARPEFRTLPVTRGDLVVTVSATGSVEPVELIDVGAQIVGIIKKFGPDPSRPGRTIDYRSRVKEKDVLAQLDDAPQQAEMKKAAANHKLAEGELSRSEAQLKQAESAFRRAEKLHDTNSATEFENALASFEIAKAEAAVAGAKLEQVKVAKEQAEINLAYTIVRSPVDGVVIDRRVNVGQTVVAGLNAPSLFLLAKDLSHMLVWGAVNEADIGDIHIGQPVTFKVDAFRDQTFSGTVSQIRLNASMAQNVVTYGVVVDVDNPDEKLLPYMTAKLQFEVARRPNVIRVPNQAIRWQPTWAQVSPSEREGLQRLALGNAASKQDADAPDEETEPKVNLGSPAVWVVAEDGFVRPIQVRIGLSDGILTEITEGKLAVGSQIVINAVREARPDFVSSFISQVVNIKK